MRRSTLLLCALSLGACDSDSFTGDGGTDASSDVPPVNGGDGGDGGNVMGDGGADAGPSLRFCQAIDAAFCADFDTPNDAGAGFSTSTVAGGWTIMFENAQHASAPTAAEFDIPDDAGTGTAFLESPIGVNDAGAFTTATLEFDALFPDIATTNNQPLFSFVFGNPYGGLFTRFGLAHEAGWRFENLALTKGVNVAGTIPTGTWTHVKMIVQLATATTGSVTIVIGGEDGGSANANATINNVETVGQNQLAPPAPWPMDLQLGPQCMNGARATAFIYDNVVVRME